MRLIRKRLYSTAVFTLTIIFLVHTNEGITMGMKTEAKVAPAIEKDFRVNYITGIEKDPKGKRIKVVTHQSGILWLKEQNVDDFSGDLNLIRSAMREKSH
jgi:hypothetical protein